MKNESVLNILMYFFKNHMQKNCTLNLGEKILLTQLEKLGFQRTIIHQAFNWLNNLSYSSRESIQLPKKNSFRVFNDHECGLLNLECRRFLITLERQAILAIHTQELVINQAIELSPKEINVSLIKWVTLMVLLINLMRKKPWLARSC